MREMPNLGGELEVAFAPDRHWEFQGGLGLLDTRYLSLSKTRRTMRLKMAEPVITLESVLAKSPHTSLDLSGVPKWDLPQGNTLALRVDGSYTSKLSTMCSFTGIGAAGHGGCSARRELHLPTTIGSSVAGNHLTNASYIICWKC